MIANIEPALLHMPLTYLAQTNIHGRLGGCTVNHDKVCHLPFVELNTRQSLRSFCFQNSFGNLFVLLLDALAIGVQFFTDAMERDSEVGASEMLEDFLMAQMDDPMVRYEDHRRMMVGEVVLIYESDGTARNFMGW